MLAGGGPTSATPLLAEVPRSEVASERMPRRALAYCLRVCGCVGHLPSQSVGGVGARDGVEPSGGTKLPELLNGHVPEELRKPYQPPPADCRVLGLPGSEPARPDALNVRKQDQPTHAPWSFPSHF